jgi:uncharacterized membrane protein
MDKERNSMPRNNSTLEERRKPLLLQSGTRTVQRKDGITNHNSKGKDIIFVLFVCIVTAVLSIIPTGFEKKEMYKHSIRVKARIVDTNNQLVKQFGIIKQGNQQLTIHILDSRFKGQELAADNMIIGKMELDKIFKPGDMTLTVLDIDPLTDQILHANVLDYHRLEAEWILLLLFAGLLIAFAGWTGAKALISFIFSTVMIWKVMIPALLRGYDPILLALGVVVILTSVIIFLIGGFTKKGMVAFLGAFSGVLFTCLFSLLSSFFFHINGAVRPFSETLLYSGFGDLNLHSIMLAGVFLASSGAVMDLSMDIAASLQEVKTKYPTITRKELIVSGLNISRAVIGTMTTTLLLAYSGSYTTMLMVFMAQGIPLTNVFNLSYVSAEIFHTLAGSLGLILVAPFTALIGGILYQSSPQKDVIQANQ